MSKPNPQRIATDGPQGGMGNPFAALDLGGLPEGPAHVEPPVKESKLGRLHIRKEKAQRGGKTVTVVFGFNEAVSDERIEELARHLRNACGCGGTVKDGEIEIQGDQREKIAAILTEAGFRPVFAGG